MNWYGLPEGWKVRTVGRVTQIKAGDAAPQKREFFQDGSVPFVRVQDLGRYRRRASLTETGDKVKELALQRCHLKVLPKGSMLFPKSGMSTFLNHRAILGTDACVVSHLAVLIPSHLTTSRYLYFYFCTIDVTRWAERTTLPALRLQEIAKIPIPLPPLEERRGMVEILEQADELRRKKKEALALIDKVIRSLFLDMLDDPTTNPKGWEVKELGEVAEVRAGSPAPQDRRYFENGRHPFLRVQDLGIHGKTRNLTQTHDLINDLAIQELRPTLARKGSILLPKSGMSMLLNHRAILGMDAYVVSHLAIITPRQVTTSEYLFEFLCGLDASCIAQRTTLPSISLSSLKAVKLPCPPFALQQRFAELVAHFEEKRRQMERAAEELERLYQSLLKKAFTGELTRAWREANKVRWELPQLTERQKLLLGVLHYHNSVRKVAPPVTVVMKNMFLLQEEQNVPLGYSFVPYKYGPFSKEVYQDLEALEREMLVVRAKRGKNVERQETAIDEEAVEDVKQILETVPQHKRQPVDELMQRYGSLGFEELLNYVYAKYPEFAVEPKRRRR